MVAKGICNLFPGRFYRDGPTFTHNYDDNGGYYDDDIYDYGDANGSDYRLNPNKLAGF